jgi:hypothetical protein
MLPDRHDDRYAHVIRVQTARRREASLARMARQPDVSITRRSRHDIRHALRAAVSAFRLSWNGPDVDAAR